MYCERIENIDPPQFANLDTETESTNNDLVLDCHLESKPKKLTKFQHHALLKEKSSSQAVPCKQNIEFSVMHDQFCDMENARLAFHSVLINHLLFLQILTKTYLEAVTKGTQLTNMINKNKSDENRLKNRSVGCSEIDYHLIINQLNKALLEEKFNPKQETVELIKSVQEIHFLPVFLEQVHHQLQRYCLENTITEDIQEKVKKANRHFNSLMSSRKIIINHNMRLVSYAVRKYRNENVDFNDQVQDGFVGLIKAVDRFTLSKGTQFSTYAIYWIRQAITRGQIDHSREIRLPYHIAVKAFHVFETLNELKIESNKMPSINILAKKCDMKHEDVEAILTFFKPMQSIYNNSTDNDELPVLLDSLEQTVYPTQEEVVSQENLSKKLVTAINELPEREAQIINQRFGINSDVMMTLDDIASRLSISRERVRQIQNRALEKLRKQLKDDISCYFDLCPQA